MNSDGSKPTRLTNHPAFDLFTSWSPDGKKIAFMSQYEIYVMNADGTDQTRLTNNSDDDELPSWGPPGS